MSGFLLALGGGCERRAAAGPCTGRAIEEPTAHFAGAARSSTAVSEEVGQPAGEAEEPEDAEGVAELRERVDDTVEVDSSICIRLAKVSMTEWRSANVTAVVNLSACVVFEGSYAYYYSAYFFIRNVLFFIAFLLVEVNLLVTYL